MLKAVYPVFFFVPQLCSARIENITTLHGWNEVLSLYRQCVHGKDETTMFSMLIWRISPVVIYVISMYDWVPHNL